MADVLTPAAALALLSAGLLTPRASARLLARGVGAPNYRGRLLAPAGIALSAAFLAGCLPLLSLAPGEGGELRLAVAVVFLAGWGGFLDDLAGRDDPKGLRGHLAALRAGRPTAGAAKALALLAAAGLAGAGLGQGAAGAASAGALVALAAHALNCLDLRPGRAGKAFLGGVGLLALAATAAGRPLPPFALLLAAALVGYLPWDLRERAMLGDAGANALGAGLGLAAAVVLPVPGRWVAVGILLAFCWLCEQTSLTRLIEANAVLRRLDAWGRR